MDELNWLNWRYARNQQIDKLREFSSFFFCFRALQSPHAHYTRIAKAVLLNMIYMSECFPSSSRRRMNRPWILLYPKNQPWLEEITWNPTMHEFYSRTFIENTSDEHWFVSPRTLRILYVTTKGNTHFRACLSIEKRGLWHLGTHRENALGPQLLVGKRTSLVHEFIH